MVQRLYVAGEQVAATRTLLEVRTSAVCSRAVRVGTDMSTSSLPFPLGLLTGARRPDLAGCRDYARRKLRGHALPELL